MKKLMLVLSVIGMVALSARSYAGEVDVLLGKLVDKGILTASEAQEIRTETNDEVAKQDKQKEEDYKKVAKDTLPDWVKNIKLNGDFRNRYQWDKTKSATTKTYEENRDRIRARLGIDTALLEDFKVGVGIATGTTTNAKSNNITLGGNDPKSIVLDYAYGQYIPSWTTPVKTTFTAGRYKNPFWEPVNAYVDPDIKLDGAALQFSYDINPDANIFLNYGFLYLGDSFPKSKDPLENIVQPGVSWKILDNVKLKSTVDFWLSEVKGMPAITGSPLTNSLGVLPDQNIKTGDVAYLNNYNVVLPKLEIGFTQPFFGFNPGFPYFSVFGEYADNISASVDHTGWLAGCKIGNETVADKFQWQLLYDHRFTEKDAFMDIYTDDDFYGGKLPSTGDEVAFNFGLSKNSWIQLKYFNTRSTTRVVSLTDDGSKLPSQTIMADWNVKF